MKHAGVVLISSLVDCERNLGHVRPLLRPHHRLLPSDLRRHRGTYDSSLVAAVGVGGMKREGVGGPAADSSGKSTHTILKSSLFT